MEYLARVVNALIESLANAEGPTRLPQAAELELVRCQRCEHWTDSGDVWERSCNLLSREAWIERMIRPGPSCRELSGVDGLAI